MQSCKFISITYGRGANIYQQAYTHIYLPDRGGTIIIIKLDHSQSTHSLGMILSP